MPASRIRVRLPHSHGGLLALTAVLGLVMAMPMSAWQLAGMQLLQNFPNLPVFTFGITAISVLAISELAVVISIVRQCQHVQWVVAAGALYGFTFILFVALGHLLENPLRLSPLAVTEYAIGIGVVTLLTTAAALLALLVQRTFSYRIIEQDGTLCDGCGYPAGRSQSSTCPECGHACDPGAMTFSDRLIARLGRRSRFVFAGLGFIVLLGFALVVWSEHDYRTLGHTFGGVTGQWTQTHWMQTYRAVDDDPHEMVVYVQLERRPAWKPHKIHISLGHIVIRQQDGMNLIGTGEPHITVAVPITASRRVLRSGPSEAMIMRLREAAEAAQWQHARWWHVAERTVQVPWNEPQ